MSQTKLWRDVFVPSPMESGASKERFASESSWTWMFDQRRCLWKCVLKIWVVQQLYNLQIQTISNISMRSLKQVEAAAAMFHYTSVASTCIIWQHISMIFLHSCWVVRFQSVRGNAGNGQNDRSGVLDSSPSHQRPETMEIVKNQTWSPVSLSLNNRGHQSAV